MGANPGLKPVLKPKAKTANTKPKLGLRAWMNRVLEECDNAEKGFDADAVHDLRVALRRCRSLADGLRSIDPDSSWNDMKKAGKKLFQALGDLRDMQVMQGWIEKLQDQDSEDSAKRAAKGSNNGSDSKTANSFHSKSEDQSDSQSTNEPPAESTIGTTDDSAADANEDAPHGSSDDNVAAKLLKHVHDREAECKQLALKDLNQFDRKQWKQWSRSLPQRAARVRPGSIVYLHLALEKWTDAYELHKRAMRTRSQTAIHELRIGIKRFRYTVENFLPRQHAAWGDDLKELQDLLGDVHDLDVLWNTAIDPSVGAFADAASRTRWRAKLSAERSKRIARYREMMIGHASLWHVWRAELPAGAQLRSAAISRLRTWAGYLDPDFARSERVTQLALLMYDGLRQAYLLKAAAETEEEVDAKSNSSYEARTVLQAAAFMHDVGKSKGGNNHHKKSYRMIRKLERPLGWTAREMELAAVIARYHRGALPRPSAKAMQQLDMADRPVAMELAGVLRLAKAMEMASERGVPKDAAPNLEVSAADGSVVVRMSGYSAQDRAAEEVAAARHLLETVLRRPVLVRGLRAVRRTGIGGTPKLRIVAGTRHEIEHPRRLIQTAARFARNDKI